MLRFGADKSRSLGLGTEALKPTDRGWDSVFHSGCFRVLQIPRRCFLTAYLLCGVAGRRIFRAGPSCGGGSCVGGGWRERYQCQPGCGWSYDCSSNPHIGCRSRPTLSIWCPRKPDPCPVLFEQGWYHCLRGTVDSCQSRTHCSPQMIRSTVSTRDIRPTLVRFKYISAVPKSSPASEQSVF